MGRESDSDKSIPMKDRDKKNVFPRSEVNMMLRQQSEGYLKIIESLEDAYHESEMRLRQVIDLVPHPIHAKDRDGRYILANKAFSDQYRLTPDLLIGKNAADLIPEASALQNELREDREVIDRRETKLISETVFESPDGRKRYFRLSKVPFYFQGKVAVLSVAIDITDQKAAETTLQLAHDKLEHRVAERTRALSDLNELLAAKTRGLEAMNTTLRVLLQKREKDRTDIEENVLHTVKDLVQPYLVGLRNTSTNARQKAYIEAVEATLDQLASSFARELKSRHFQLTPSELRIANLIKNGKTTKEIAMMSGLSIKTVEFHRENIRSKLGIKNKKRNLRTYILSLP